MKISAMEVLSAVGFTAVAAFLIGGWTAGKMSNAEIAAMQSATAPPGKCFAKGPQAASACYAPDRQVRVVCADAEGCGSIRLETVEEFKRLGAKD
jgi:hypothetical protein